MNSHIRYTDDDLCVIVQDWAESDPDQAIAINLASELLGARTELDTLRRQLAEAEADRDSWCDQTSQRVKDWDKMRQRAEAAEAKLALAERDARRYRWVRACDRKGELAIHVDTMCDGELLGMEQLDAAIDAAIAAGEVKDD